MNILLLIFNLWFTPDIVTVAYIEIQVDAEGHYYYNYGYDGKYFDDFCNVLTLCALEAQLRCGEELMLEYAREFAPVENDTIRKF